MIIGQQLSDESLLDNWFFMINAGYITTATGIAAMAKEIFHNKEVMEKLKNEQKAIIEKFGKNITPEALAEMKFCDACVKEALRVHPPVPGTLRLATDDVKIENRRVPKGWRIFFQVCFSS